MIPRDAAGQLRLNPGLQTWVTWKYAPRYSDQKPPTASSGSEFVQCNSCKVPPSIYTRVATVNCAKYRQQ